MISLRSLMSLLSYETNTKISSLKIRWVKEKNLAVFIPSTALNLWLDITILLNPSTTNRNKRGDNGKYFLRHLSILKNGVAYPLTRGERDTKDI